MEKEAILNDLGREQAENLGNVSRERGDKFDIMFTSDLKRAIESSNIAFPEVEKITDNRLRECNYGDLDGEHKSLVVYEEHVAEAFPNGESLEDVEKVLVGMKLIKMIGEKQVIGNLDGNI